MGFDLSRSDVESLLETFLRSAVGADLQMPLKDMRDLPERLRQYIQIANHTGRPWTAWSTLDGPLAAWGHCDVPGSQQLHAYLLHIEWWQSPNDHHALWCYCPAKWPTDWVVGRPESIRALGGPMAGADVAPAFPRTQRAAGRPSVR
jgi:hypothetical protein